MEFVREMFETSLKSGWKPRRMCSRTQSQPSGDTADGRVQCCLGCCVGIRMCSSDSACAAWI